ncbi:hypothetical protein [Telmatospirillum sp.]|uniref:hypothetical protein n=1 Tax=Telmatospirillum sp. TaxID=2079197 RepID=UPI002847D717|nr:hypothetical protein [Telmatospirillum sp.]MDR3441044.1 hypothetical protein [Telmatospirillum sp.]
MAKYHIFHCIPDPRLHIFNGYNEVIETVIWGLQSFGHEVTYDINKYSGDAINIIFGAQMMGVDVLKMFPKGTIVYNLEQLYGLFSGGRSRDDFCYMAENFIIWDYSDINIEMWSSLFSPRSIRHVPIGYAPFLGRIAKPAEQDIDVLIYGAPSDSRLLVLKDLCNLGLSTMFFFGLYRQARDDLIGRSKIVLNINSNAVSRIFSIVRVSYLLANRKAVVADFNETMSVELDMPNAVRFVSLEKVAETCFLYAADAAARQTLENQGFAAIQKRDIRAILSAALS